MAPLDILYFRYCADRFMFIRKEEQHSSIMRTTLRSYGKRQRKKRIQDDGTVNPKILILLRSHTPIQIRTCSLESEYLFSIPTNKSIQLPGSLLNEYYRQLKEKSRMSHKFSLHIGTLYFVLFSFYHIAIFSLLSLSGACSLYLAML